MAKNPGKKFEEDFIRSLPERCDVTRLKDTGGWGNATNLRFSSTNPCDFIVFSAAKDEMDTGNMYKLELKSVKGKSLPFSNIKEHQLTSLLESQSKGVTACFVVNFRAVNETYLVAVHLMANLIGLDERKSLSLAYARDNCILVKQSLIRVRWKYDLDWL